jgi:hypothetical protein
MPRVLKKRRGLKFNYKIGEQTLVDKFLTIEDFVECTFPKDANPLAPNNGTEIFNIRFNGCPLKNNFNIVSIPELKEALINQKDIFAQTVYSKKKTAVCNEYIRKSVHSIDEVYDVVKDVMFNKDKNESRIILDGDVIKGNSQRYQTFFTKGLRCAKCGIEGKFFAKEKNLGDKSYHLNLYAVDENGNEVLMTKDHIIPLSKGEDNDISNYQTMCERCNFAKGNNEE